MTALQRAKKLMSSDLFEAGSAPAREELLVAAVTEAENAAAAAVLADVVRLLRHCGKLNTSARLVEALERDRQNVRKGQETEFPALRAAVPLPV